MNQLPHLKNEEKLVTSFTEAVEWLKGRSTSMIRASRRIMDDGTAAFPPQVASGYEAFWLRDYAYMLAGDIEAFSIGELEAACRLFVSKQRRDGAMVDCVRFTGEAVYKPGYGTMGQNPVADGSQFAVEVAWRTFQRTGNIHLLRSIIDSLVSGMAAVPREAETGLVFIDPLIEWDRCPYGFTDQIRKTGSQLFDSLLYLQAARWLAELLDNLELNDQACLWRAEAEKIAANIGRVFWDGEIGLFRAAALGCNQPDLWGSAFAIHIGAASAAQAKKIGRYFAAHYHEIVLAGQLRHLPGGLYWGHTACERDTYQNGAFWGTPIGWFVEVLRPIDTALAERTVIDMVRDYQKNGVFECINERTGEREGRVRDYIVSVTLPLEVLRNW